MVSVLGVEAGIIDEVDAATDHVTRGKGGPVRLPRARRTERVPVVAVVTVRVLVPTCAPHSTNFIAVRWRQQSYLQTREPIL